MESRASVDSRFVSRRAGIILLGPTEETVGFAGHPKIEHRSWPASNPVRNIDRIFRAASFRFRIPASCLANRAREDVIVRQVSAKWISRDERLHKCFFRSKYFPLFSSK